MSRDFAGELPLQRSDSTTRKSARAASPPPDSIDLFMRQWRDERPDLDPAPFGIFGRIHRIAGYFTRRADAWLGGLGLTWETFSLIVTLRRAGKPYAMRPTDLLRESLLSSGAVTNRIDRVEHLGLVRRIPDPNDRRGVVVQLTASGRALADRAIALHFKEMARLLDGLSPNDARRIAALLSTLLLSFENTPPGKSSGKSGDKENGGTKGKTEDKADGHRPARNGRRIGR
jgi:DNA-binding MarR family transcriptional regulator